MLFHNPAEITGFIFSVGLTRDACCVTLKYGRMIPYRSARCVKSHRGDTDEKYTDNKDTDQKDIQGDAISVSFLLAHGWVEFHLSRWNNYIDQRAAF